MAGADPASGDLVVWGPERAEAAEALLAASLPDEHLSADELLACCWEDPDPGVVLADPDGRGLVSVVARRWGDAPDAVVIAYAKVLGVHPDHRRGGLGRRLLDAAADWAWDQGARELYLGGSAPRYLFPGVDAHATEATCLAEAAGFHPAGTEVDMALASTFRADPPAGVRVARALDDADADAVRAFVAANWPQWSAEAELALDAACCFGAFVADGAEAGTAVGFCCHSVQRAGFLGPMGTDPARRGGGIGAALVGAVCRDLMIADVGEVQIAWVGPVRFYARLGARISRVYRTWRLRPPAHPT